MRSTLLLCCCCCCSLVLGCSSGAEPTGASDEGPTKEEVRAFKADGVPTPRVCEALGEPAGCDVCETAGWYGDGECDDFCDLPDSDCDSVPPANAEPVISWLSGWFGYRDVPAGPTGEHTLGAYSQATFSAAAFAASMRDFDREVRGCEGRIYSRSKEDGADKFFEFVERRDVFAGLPAYRLEYTTDAVRNPDNTAVFASVPDINAASESCNYADFYVFLDTGTVAHLSFDYRAADADLRDGPGPAGITYVDEADTQIWSRMNEYGHNGGSSIGVWTSQARSYGALLGFARAEDASDWSCVNRSYSASSEEARESYDAFSESYFELVPWVSEVEIHDQHPRVEEDIASFRSIIGDPDNIAVLSSEFQEGGRDYSESCLYYDFYILRRSGTAIRFQVNYTD